MARTDPEPRIGCIHRDLGFRVLVFRGREVAVDPMLKLVPANPRDVLFNILSKPPSPLTLNPKPQTLNLKLPESRP